MRTREPGECFIKLVAKLVVIISEQPKDPQLPVLSRLTREELARTFPPDREGTLYWYFRTATDADYQVAVVASEEDREQVLEEAALGMMDNPYFRD